MASVSTPGAQTVGGSDRVASTVSMAGLVCLLSYSKISLDYKDKDLA